MSGAVGCGANASFGYVIGSGDRGVETDLHSAADNSAATILLWGGMSALKTKPFPLPPSQPLMETSILLEPEPCKRLGLRGLLHQILGRSMLNRRRCQLLERLSVTVGLHEQGFRHCR